MKKISILLLLSILLISMHIDAQIWIIGGKDIHGNGNVIKQMQPISSFNKLKVIGNIEVGLDPSLDGKVRIEAEENLIPYIKIKTDKNGRLTITNPVKHQLITTDRKRIKVLLPFKHLDEVSLSGAGIINLPHIIKTEGMDIVLRGSGVINLNIESSNLEAKISGSGKITLNGMAINTKLVIRGGGTIDAKGMQTNKGVVQLSGSATVKVMEKSVYDVNKRGSGRVKEPKNKISLLDFNLYSKRCVNETIKKNNFHYNDYKAKQVGL